MLEGEATRDFNGEPVGAIFTRIAAQARVRQFSVNKIAELGVKPSPLRDTGGELEDGSIILTDLDSLETNQPRPFAVDVNGHHFSGTYVGVFALKANASGSIEKLACGECGALKRDGREVLRLREPADLVLLRNSAGAYEAVVAGSGGNAVRLRQ